MIALDMGQYIKSLGSEADKNPASNFEKALNKANGQLMQEYLATQDNFLIDLKNECVVYPWFCRPCLCRSHRLITCEKT